MVVRKVGENVTVELQGLRYRGRIRDISVDGLKVKLFDTKYRAAYRQVSYAVDLPGTKFPAYISDEAAFVVGT